MGCVTAYEEAKKANEANGANETNEANGANGANEANGTYGSVTRAWQPPTGYSLFGDNKVGVCFTQDGVEPNTGYFYKSGSSWRTTVDITSGTYYLYGYAPHSTGISCEISSSATPNDNSSYSTGAIIKIKNVPAITPEDVCVVIGAKNGKDDYRPDPATYEVTGLQRGDFEYVASGGSNNYVYLLLDHLFAALRVQIRVQGDYNALRTIKLKGVYLQTSDGVTKQKAKTDVTVTLRKTADGADPVSSIDYTPQGEDVGNGTVFESKSGETLTESYTPYLCHFMPTGVTTLIMTCKYDVYDKKGNKVREDCQATNTLLLSDLYSGQTAARRGCRYTVNFTIQPTYLYVMSDPDLDNPTVTIE